MGSHEIIMVFYNRPPTYNPQKRKRTTEHKSGKRINKSSTYGRENPIYIDSQNDYIHPDTALFFNSVFGTVAKSMDHPTQKPVALLEYMIRTYTNKGETVLDNTMGSGSTMVACVNTQRNGIGIEKPPDDPTETNYFPVAEKRIKEAQQQMRIF